MAGELTMEFTYVPSTEHVYPNLTVLQILCDGQPDGWRIVPNEGYVMYDVNGEYYETDPETMEEVQVMYYYTSWDLPRNYNFANFHWAAKLRSEVDENYIFGLPNPGNDHEVM